MPSAVASRISQLSAGRFFAGEFELYWFTTNVCDRGADVFEFRHHETRSAALHSLGSALAPFTQRRLSREVVCGSRFF